MICFTVSTWTESIISLRRITVVSFRCRLLQPALDPYYSRAAGCLLRRSTFFWLIRPGCTRQICSERKLVAKAVGRSRRYFRRRESPTYRWSFINARSMAWPLIRSVACCRNEQRPFNDRLLSIH